MDRQDLSALSIICTAQYQSRFHDCVLKKGFTAIRIKAEGALQINLTTKCVSVVSFINVISI